MVKRGRPKKDKAKNDLNTIRKNSVVKEERLGTYQQTKEGLKASEGKKNIKNGKKAVAATGYFQPDTNLSLAQVKDFLLRSLWTETCVNIIADEVVKNKLHTQPFNEEIESFLKYPSDKEPLFLIRKQCIKDMLRYGNGGIAIEYEGEKPFSLQAVPGYSIRVTDAEPATYKITDATKTSDVFIQDEEGEDIELTLAQLMHFAIDKDSDMTLGRSPLDRGYYQLNIDKQLYENFNNLVQKGFQLPFFVGAKDASSKDMDEFLEFLNYAIKENAKAFGINAAVDFSSIPHFTPEDILATMKWMGIVIANLYKVPPFMLNLIAGVGSMNAREQKARFLENVVAPIVEYESYLYTLALAKKGFGNDEVEIKSTDIYSRITFEKAKLARVLTPDGNILTPDEVRDMFLGLPAIVEVDKAE